MHWVKDTLNVSSSDTHSSTNGHCDPILDLPIIRSARRMCVQTAAEGVRTAARKIMNEEGKCDIKDGLVIPRRPPDIQAAPLGGKPPHIRTESRVPGNGPCDT